MAKVPNAVEILRKIWTTWVGRRVGQTDGRAIAYSNREREFTFAKKHYVSKRVGDVDRMIVEFPARQWKQRTFLRIKEHINNRFW